MRLITGFGILFLLIAGLWLFGGGLMDGIGDWAAAGQRKTQNALAGYLRALKRGDLAALAGLLGVCFAYGFFHAAGPGHGKLVIGGYGMASHVRAWRLSVLAVLSSLAQSVTAIVLVVVGWSVLSIGRERLTGLADEHMSTMSAIAICGVGLWLAYRGYRGLRHASHAGHASKEDGTCSQCGHSHGPSVDQADGVNSLRDAVALIASIAIRPCTGALFLLLITFQMGIPWAGILGTFVMGIGTASITVLVALVSVYTRNAAFAGLQTGSSIPSLIQLVAGGLIATIAAQMVLAAL